MSPERLPPYTRVGAFFKEHLAQITAVSTVSLLTLNSLILLNHDETKLLVQATPVTAPALPPIELPTTVPILLGEDGMPLDTIPPEIVNPPCTKSSIAWLPETVARWHSYAAETAAHFQIPDTLLEILMTFESMGDPNVESDEGAVGLIQILPSTAEEIMAQLNLPQMDLKDPATNIYLSGQYIRNTLNKGYIDMSQGFTAEVVRQIAIAYNGGLEWLKYYLQYGPGGLPDETKAYSERVVLAWEEQGLPESQAYNSIRDYAGVRDAQIAAAVVGTSPC